MNGSKKYCKSNVKYEGFTASVPQMIAKDQHTSIKALGVLLYIFSNRINVKHNRWQLYESQVINHFRFVAGKYQIQSAFKELQRRGYLEKHLNRTNGKGNFVHGTVWIVHSEPIEMRKQSVSTQSTRTLKIWNPDNPSADNSDSQKSATNRINLNRIKDNRINYHPDGDDLKKMNGQFKGNNEHVFKGKSSQIISSSGNSTTRPTEPQKTRRGSQSTTNLKVPQLIIYSHLKKDFHVKFTSRSCNVINLWVKKYSLSQVLQAIHNAYSASIYSSKVDHPLSYINGCLKNINKKPILNKSNNIYKINNSSNDYNDWNVIENGDDQK